MKIADALKVLLSNADNADSTIVALVVAHNNDGTIDADPVDGSARIHDVRLRASIEGDEGLLVLPEVGSSVIIGYSNGIYYVILTDAVNSVLIRIGSGFEVSINQNGDTLINGGELSALVVISKLATEIQKLNNFLATLRSTIEITAPVPGDGGLAIKTAIVAALSSLPLANISNDTIGNPKIKH